jgi:putative PIG3 family NAD(P)H quinone oxidoreductase
MRAVVAPEAGGPDVLQVVELPDPEPGPGDLLIRVQAAGVNRADVMQRRGLYPPPPGASEVLGLEVAGVVEAVGAAVEGWQPGDRACAVLAGGGYAELALVPAATAMPWPAPRPGVDDAVQAEVDDAVQAGAVPEVFTTAYDNLVNRGRLRAGETALLHGGASGVGTAGIQLARRHGARVIVTAGSTERVAACLALGADAGIDYRTEDFVTSVADLTDGRGVDVILDVVGGRYLDRNLACLATEGRLVVIGLQGGAQAELDLGRMLTRRLTIHASTLRARSVEEKAALARQLVAEVWPGFADGSLHAVVDRVLPLDDAVEAHRVMEAGEQVGKIVLRP